MPNHTPISAIAGKGEYVVVSGIFHQASYLVVHKKSKGMQLLYGFLRLRGETENGYRELMDYEMLPLPRHTEFRHAEQVCFKRFTVELLQVYLTRMMCVSFARVSGWTPWTPWSPQLTFLHQRRSRVCCSGNCTSGPSQEVRMGDTHACLQPRSQVSAALAELQRKTTLILESSAEMNGTCVYSFSGPRRSFIQMRKICETMGLTLYSIANGNFTKKVMEQLLGESVETVFGYTTGFLRMSDGFWAVMNKKIYSLHDIIGNGSIYYLGRLDLKTFHFYNGIMSNFVGNCVALHFIPRDLNSFRQDSWVHPSVGLSTRECDNYRFICQDPDQRWNLDTLSTSVKAEEGCLKDHLGFSYKGDTAHSATGKPCLPWKEVQTFSVRSSLLRSWSATWIRNASGLGNQSALPSVNTSGFSTSGDLFPHGEEPGARCRNERSWPFVVSDPVCLVEDPASSDVTLEICSVPFCASKRGQFMSGDSIDQVTDVPLFVCFTRLVLLVGRYRLSEEYDYLTKEENDHCRVDYIVYPIFIATASLSISLNLLSAVFILKTSLKKRQKYKQLLYLNVSSVLATGTCFYFLTYRYFLPTTRVTCVLGYQVFALSWSVFFASLVSLSIDCLVAVYFPLKHKIIMTNSRVVKSSLSVLLIMIAFYIVYPVYRYGWAHDGYLHWYCDLLRTIPSNFLTLNLLIGILSCILIIILNIAIGIGVIKALRERKKICNEEQKIKDKMLKLTIRLGLTIVLNLGCAFPVILEPLRLKRIPVSIALTLVVSSGLWNIMIFFFGDTDIIAMLKGKVGKSSKRR